MNSQVYWKTLIKKCSNNFSYFAETWKLLLIFYYSTILICVETATFLVFDDILPFSLNKTFFLRVQISQFSLLSWG